MLQRQSPHTTLSSVATTFVGQLVDACSACALSSYFLCPDHNSCNYYAIAVSSPIRSLRSILLYRMFYTGRATTSLMVSMTRPESHRTGLTHCRVIELSGHFTISGRSIPNIRKLYVPGRLVRDGLQSVNGKSTA
jgi:hypothetical protein